jgi:hypothetical protein
MIMAMAAAFAMLVFMRMVIMMAVITARTMHMIIFVMMMVMIVAMIAMRAVNVAAMCRAHQPACAGFACSRAFGHCGRATQHGFNSVYAFTHGKSPLYFSIYMTVKYRKAIVFLNAEDGKHI